jgi:type I restriction enzyme R subunit
MKGHNLMQAIARVNRVFKDKQGGLVVDYIGIGNELKAAMKEYTAAQGRGKPTVDAHEALSLLLEKLDVLGAMLHGFDWSGFKSNGFGVIRRLFCSCKPDSLKSTLLFEESRTSHER